MGRPKGSSEYTEAVADEICERLALGESLNHICSGSTMPAHTTVLRWLAAETAFRTQYAHARQLQADFYHDEVTDIADNATDASLARLQIDARKWKASKLAPKKYGDKLEVGGDPDAPILHRVERLIIRPPQLEHAPDTDR